MDAEVTHIVQSGWKNWKKVSGGLCDRRMNVNIKGKVYRTAKSGTGVRSRDMVVEEGTGNAMGGRRNTDATMDVWSFSTRQDNK